ncbi:MAG: hypothetical protein ABIK96_13680 [bacterium]
MNGEQHDTNRPEYAGAPPPRETYGVPVNRPVARKSPALATTLSLFPGLGQIYVGYYQQGFIHAAIVATTITILAGGAGIFTPLLGVSLAFFWLFNLIDANRRALHFNRIADGFGGEDVPDDIALPGARGSVLGGTILAAMGLLIFLDLNFGISLEWLEDWWPLALVGMGVWMILKARRKD